jgi:uncharacterized protein (DUF433 family)
MLESKLRYNDEGTLRRHLLQRQQELWRETMDKLDRITIRPEVCLGQPTIRGTRITVSVVLKMLAGSKSVQDVLAAYPELEQEDVRQASLHKT